MLDQLLQFLITGITVGSTFAGWSGDADCSDGKVTLTAQQDLYRHLIIISRRG